MSDHSSVALSSPLIAGRYAVDTSQSLTDAGAGLPCFLAHDRSAGDGRRVALAVARDFSPRVRHLKALSDPIDNLMVPLGHGIAPLSGGKGDGYFVVCPTPPGPPVSANLNVWPDKALLDLVLAPIARVLDALHGRKLTHRAIRPNNVFQAARGQLVTLGAAWAAPPAMHQPAVCEPPYSAMCHSAGRGDGSIADDVYALGVLLVTLAGGKIPMDNMDDAIVIRWKLDLGSFQALTRDVTLSPSLAELLRGMLAEEPDHRPLPAALLDLAHLRGRRIAARPMRRSQRPLMLNDIAVFDGRMLGFALLSDEKKAIQFLRNGLVTQWLRRSVGDATMAAHIEDLVRGGAMDSRPGPLAYATLVMRTIQAVNPRMPLCWRGVAFWPDALPSLLAAATSADTTLSAPVEELLVNHMTGTWSPLASRAGQPESSDMSQYRHLLKDGGPNGMLRLFYALNPMLPCRGPGMATEWIASLFDLLRFLERTAVKTGDTMIVPPIAAFIAARADREIEIQVTGLSNISDANTARLPELVLLRNLQAKYHPAPMPALASWVVKRLLLDLERWRNQPRREALKRHLEELAQAGMLSRLLTVMNDAAARTADERGLRAAVREIATIDAEVAAIDHGDEARLTDAARFGQAITGGIGLSIFILMVMSALLR